MTVDAMRCLIAAIDVQVEIFLAKAAFGTHGVQCTLLGGIHKTAMQGHCYQ